MSRSFRRALGALAFAGLAAGCGSATPTSAPQAAPAATSVTLATSLAGDNGSSWAVVPVGSGANTFWQLFTRPAGSPRWSLVTPPGVADNGGLVAASSGTQAASSGGKAASSGGKASGSGGNLAVAFRPNQGLTFSPLALTANGGQTWGTGLVDSAIAAVPNALATTSGTMLALLADGSIERTSAPGGTSWTRLAAPGAVGASAAGRACGVTALTGVALTAAGTPLAAASCAHPGSAGVFADTGAGWESAGITLPGVLDTRPVQVLQLTATGNGGNMALLQDGAGAVASAVAAWTTDGTHWTVFAPLPDGPGTVRASGTGPGGLAWVLLSSGGAAVIAGPGSNWRILPAPPEHTTVLAAGPAGTLDALAVSGSTLIVYRLTPAGAWQREQSITVPIQAGSSA